VEEKERHTIQNRLCVLELRRQETKGTKKQEHDHGLTAALGCGEWSGWCAAFARGAGRGMPGEQILEWLTQVFGCSFCPKSKALLRSRGAMALFQQGIKAASIMKYGRWTSTSFLNQTLVLHTSVTCPKNEAFVGRPEAKSFVGPMDDRSGDALGTC